MLQESTGTGAEEKPPAEVTAREPSKPAVDVAPVADAGSHGGGGSTNFGSLGMEMPGLTKKQFSAGAHGLVWKQGSLEIERVSCQARLLGVQKKWTITTINKEGEKPISIVDGAHAWQELMKCKKSGQKYIIWFTKDQKSILEDQAKDAAEKARKEKEAEERKAREAREKQIREEAERKRAEEIARKKDEYWKKDGDATEAVAPPAEDAPPTAAPAEPSATDAPAADAETAEDDLDLERLPAADTSADPDAKTAE